MINLDTTLILWKSHGCHRTALKNMFKESHRNLLAKYYTNKINSTRQCRTSFYYLILDEPKLRISHGYAFTYKQNSGIQLLINTLYITAIQMDRHEATKAIIDTQPDAIWYILLRGTLDILYIHTHLSPHAVIQNLRLGSPAMYQLSTCFYDSVIHRFVQ